MKILYVTTTGGTMGFFKSLIMELMDNGNIVDIACGESQSVPEFYRQLGCNIYQLDCTRNPLNIGNLRAIKQIKKIVKKERYDIVHCHTPIASVCTRFACKKERKKGTQVVYTAHGFHFYTGAPLKNWIIYYPIEKWLSRYTDLIITINNEDYKRAKQRLKSNNTEYIPGVGIDTTIFSPKKKETQKIRKELSIPYNAFLLVSVGELNENKNHSIILKALGQIKDKTIHYVIAGEGPLRESLLTIAKREGCEEQVHLLGYRSDIPELYREADVCVFPSIREGLGLAAIEGMASGLPLIVSDNRGTRGLLNSENAIVCKAHSVDEFKCAIIKLKHNPILCKELGAKNVEKARLFDVKIVNSLMKKLYMNLLD